MKILLTGGSRGIGAACVEALQDARHTVAVVSRTATTNGDLNIQADLLQSYERNNVIDSVIYELGGLDVLVNNAGAQVHAPFVDYECYQWKQQLDLLLTAPFILSQQAARYMLAAGGGQIINILSTSALQGARNIVGYVAAKHGLLGLTRAMAVELAPKVRVNGIVPGLVDTEMTAEYITAERRALLESLTPAGRFVTPQEVAAALVWLIGSSGVYGQTIIVDNGWSVKNIA